jgi:hypothetical protein
MSVAKQARDVAVQSLSGQVSLPADDIDQQHWLIARRRLCGSG